MVEWKRLTAILIVLGCFTIPVALAVLTPSFSDTIWQTPTMKADTYYVGAATVIANSTGLFGAELYRNGETIGDYIASLGVGATLTQASPYSYICWENAGTCYANSTYGGTNYSGAVESTVLQNAINAVELRGGGVIFLKASHYDLAAGLVIDDDNVVLMGEGYENTYLHVASGQDGITVGNGIDRIFSIGVEGIFIQNAGVYTVNSTGLLLKGQSHSYFRDVNIESFMYGVEVDSSAQPTTYNRYDNIKCIGGMFGVYQYGAPSDNQGSWTQLNLIGAGKTVAGSIGWLHLCGNSNTWESLSVESYETAIDLDIGPTGWNLNNRFVGVFIEDCDIGIQYNAARPGARAQFIGLWMATTATLIDNYSPTRGIDFEGLLVTSTGARARNMGTSNVASGATIAHGLALGITPRICSVTVSGATPYKISYTVDATNITVYHDAGGAINVTWYVEI